MERHEVLISALDERLRVARPVDFHYVLVVGFVGAELELRETVYERVQYEYLACVFGALLRLWDR